MTKMRKIYCLTIFMIWNRLLKIWSIIINLFLIFSQIIKYWWIFSDAMIDSLYFKLLKTFSVWNLYFVLMGRIDNRWLILNVFLTIGSEVSGLLLNENKFPFPSGNEFFSSGFLTTCICVTKYRGIIKRCVWKGSQKTWK